MVSSPIVETVVNLILWVITHLGLPGLLLLMAVESFGIPPLPSEVILPFAGFLVATGALPLGGVLVAALVGGLLGSYIAYLVGRYARHWLTKGPEFLRLEPRHLDTMDRWFTRHGEVAVIGARLVPVIRSYISYPAGTARMEPVRFGVFSLAGAAPFTLALVYLGIELGKNWDEILPIFHVLDYVVIAFLVLAVVYLVLRWKNVLAPGWPPHRAA
jgi:membrane protein DedA with SNARE-associated domain